jgi:hypothetical protein
MKNLHINDSSEYYFEFEGEKVFNPVIKGNQPVDPTHYGFEVWSTGGGCTAHCQEFKFGDKTVIMLLTDGNLTHVSDDSKEITGGLFDDNLDDCFHNLNFSR